MPLNLEFCGSPSVALTFSSLHGAFMALEPPALPLSLTTTTLPHLHPHFYSHAHSPNGCEMWEEDGNLFFLWYLAILKLLYRRTKSEISVPYPLHEMVSERPCRREYFWSHGSSRIKYCSQDNAKKSTCPQQTIFKRTR